MLIWLLDSLLGNVGVWWFCMLFLVRDSGGSLDGVCGVVEFWISCIYLGFTGVIPSIFRLFLGYEVVAVSYLSSQE